MNSRAYFQFDRSALQRTLQQAQVLAKSNGVLLRYAIKANHHPQVLAEILAANCHLDCVSGFEIQEAIHQNFSASQICFAGAGKMDEEISLALDQNIAYFNVESLEELHVLNQLAKERGVSARVCLRVNPNVSADTHPYISTGLYGNKFGIDENQVPQAFRILSLASNLEWAGFHFHIGSQITNNQVFHDYLRKIAQFTEDWCMQGRCPQVLNVGGGLGIDYGKRNEEQNIDFENYFSLIQRYLSKFNCSLEVELGRALVANCMKLFTQVLYTKTSGNRNLAIVSAGMNDNIRPALYNASHFIEPVGLAGPLRPWDVHGPICESSDCFGRDLLLPNLQRGDWLCMHGVGAYVQSMASQYNLRPLAEMETIAESVFA